MKKRKTYEISIIDKTYSKTITDESKFYTSDTALELGFELKETEYDFESAEIVLLNVDDRSLVTRPVVKVLDSFTYELDDDIIAHYGEWRGQLRFEQAGEVYVSSPVKFRIENDLSNERPPQLSDVQSWVSLKRYADELTEELKQAVLSVEGMEDTFNTNELARQTIFVTAEQSRQTTFETNESERTETFNTNEDIRQTQELEREKAESQRQTAFDDNEANRTDTFNANEATRQANEEERVLAENERGNAEARRKVDHENRSAELAGKADKVVVSNFMNPSLVFSNTGVTHTVNDGVVDVTLIEPFTGVRGVFRNIQDTVEGHIYLVSADYMVSSESSAHIGNYNDRKSINITKFNTWETINVTITRGNSSAFTWYIEMVNPQAGDGFKLRNLMVIDLTDIFGVGNEPTKEEMDRLIKITGYIDGEYALNNKEMLSSLMKGIGEKANKKQEDWITPTLLGGASGNAAYLKDEFGFVHFKGRVSSAGDLVTMFVIPSGYRPGVNSDFIVFSTADAKRVRINVSGNVDNSNSQSFVELSSIIYKAER